MHNLDEELKEKNRLLLWSYALDKSYNLLQIALRAEYLKQDQEVESIWKLNLEYESCHISPARNSNWSLNIDNILKVQEFDKNKRENMKFGSSRDLHFLSISCKELSIVYFCQILNHWNKSSNTAANDKNTKRLSTIKEKSWLDKGKISILLDKIKEVRDQMIAHADWNAFNIENISDIQTTYYWSFVKITAIDWGFYEKVLIAFRFVCN